MISGTEAASLVSHLEYELLVLLPMDVRRSQHSSMIAHAHGHGSRKQFDLGKKHDKAGKVFSGLLRKSWQKAKEVSDAGAPPS